MSNPFIGLSSGTSNEERHLRFQRQSRTRGNWEARLRPARPWLFDIGMALILIAVSVAGFAGFDFAADYFQSIGWIN